MRQQSFQRFVQNRVAKCYNFHRQKRAPCQNVTYQTSHPVQVNSWAYKATITKLGTQNGIKYKEFAKLKIEKQTRKKNKPGYWNLQIGGQTEKKKHHS